MDKNEVWCVENARAPGADAISDRRRKNRMFDRERFECYSKNVRRRTFSNYVAIFHGILLQFLPRFFGRIHRTRRAAFQSPRVIGMRVRKHDCPGTDAFQFSQPIKAGIDHHVCTAIRNQQRRMDPMSPRPRVDLTARAEEC